ncbi:hypothetical protein [Chitinimonas koreensis]|uniref:hypothetical protein n=1 Tax=Chitinimonas koreensis TaxID=356302 RepID=UPI0012F768B8|nr:hypothetical protein [Chitinimonas koreensis]QNM95446.1 hypothetical protein H9L41_16455 [Chitinimonas koreensis]
MSYIAKILVIFVGMIAIVGLTIYGDKTASTSDIADAIRRSQDAGPLAATTLRDALLLNRTPTNGELQVLQLRAIAAQRAANERSKQARDTDLVRRTLDPSSAHGKEASR